MKRTSMCLLATICLASFAYAQVPEIINNDLIVYNVYKACVPADSIYYFAGHDGDYDNELWRTNGTPEGNEWIFDVDPDAQELYHMLASAGGLLYFRTSRHVTYTELLVSDGPKD
jgi:ELWxxDGT repeat protein